MSNPLTHICIIRVLNQTLFFLRIVFSKHSRRFAGPKFKIVPQFPHDQVNGDGRIQFERMFRFVTLIPEIVFMLCKIVNVLTKPDQFIRTRTELELTEVKPEPHLHRPEFPIPADCPLPPMMILSYRMKASLTTQST